MRGAFSHSIPRLIGYIFAGCLALAQPGTAATVTIERQPDGSHLVHLSGRLDEPDDQAFLDATREIASAVVVLQSGGGNLRPALVIGDAIRHKRFSTRVRRGDVCASACAFIWLAGTPREMEPSARIGFHAAYVETNGEKRETGVGNALIGAFLARLGLSDWAVVYVTQAAPTSLTWLSREDATRVGIHVDFVGTSESAVQDIVEVRPKTLLSKDQISEVLLRKHAIYEVIRLRDRKFFDAIAELAYAEHVRGEDPDIIGRKAERLVRE